MDTKINNVKSFNKTFVDLLDLFITEEKSTWVSLKLKYLRAKTVSAVAKLDVYAINKLYKDIIEKKDKIVADDEKYFLQTDCTRFVFSMSQKYDEDLVDSLKLVGFLRTLYTAFSPARKNTTRALIKQLLSDCEAYKTTLK
jgi:hypothetical protein